MVVTNTARLGFPDFPVQRSIEILRSAGASTLDKKEAIASIGRKRDPKMTPTLIEYAQDSNPEIAMQAIRGLLVFRADPAVRERLSQMREHPNDMIREVLRQELDDSAHVDEDAHAASPDFMKNVVVQGDVLDALRRVPDRSVHLTFTSPPYYNARDYSIYRSYDEYLDFLERVFKDVHRVTKEGRFFVLNTSPVIVPRAGRKYSSRRYPVPFDIHARFGAIGWEFIDDIVWAKPEESVKNRVAGFEANRKPLTYKPNVRTEFLMVYRKKSPKLIDWNLRQYSQEAIERSKVPDGIERSNIWNIAPARDRVHSAVFPLELCDQVVRLYSFVGDLVFDPFAGSGTLGKAAVLTDRYFFMTEIREDYVARIQENISNVGGGFESGRPTRIMRVPEFEKAAA